MPRPRSQITYWLLCALTVVFTWTDIAGAFDNPTVYVSFSGERRIARFTQNPETGRLTAIASTAIPGHAGSLVIDPNQEFLFAALREEGRLASFRFDGTDLKLVSDVSAGDDPAYIATDRSGKFLLTAYYISNKVTVHSIGENGELSGTPLQSIPTAPNAHGINSDASNQFVFVPHTSANSIFQFRFDAKTGHLTPNQPPVLQREKSTGPRHLVFHPRLPIVYVDNEQQSSVSWYGLDQKQGTLKLLGTESTLPPDFKGVNSNADIEIHPSGKFIYCSNRGHDSLAMFAVDEQTGALTSLGQMPTESTPREFNITRSGKFLYAAGESSGKLAGFHILPDGRLQRFATYRAGKEPFWVLIGGEK